MCASAITNHIRGISRSNPPQWLGFEYDTAASITHSGVIDLFKILIIGTFLRQVQSCKYVLVARYVRKHAKVLYQLQLLRDP